MGGLGPRLRPHGRATAGVPAEERRATGLRGLSATRLILVCQGATAATRTASFPTDAAPLEPDSTEALRRLGAHLGWQACAGSAPALAARDTAAAIAATVSVDPGLRDCDHGRWTGRATMDVQTQAPEAFARWLSDPDAAPHGGETLAAVVRRARGWLDALAPGKSLAVASSPMVRALVVAALDLPAPLFWRLDVAPLSVSQLNAIGPRWRLVRLNAPP